MTVTRIIKLEEKHVEYNYDISTDEQYSKVALDVLRRRDQEGHWYFNPEGYEQYISDENKELATVSDEVAETLPQKLKDSIQKAKKAIRRAESENHQLKAWWNLLRETIDLPDEEALAKKHLWTVNLSTGPKEKERPMVQVLLESRQEHQYEGFKIIELDELD
jgi:predicted nuclease with TOPRIM domain